ncbi:lysozyme [Ottowia sp. VDI28]|uniref:lysozyme n=1 Tax=Ottowia sp. VDI28 TaxID=3133968 RepID=UPI003C2B6A02
MASASSLGKAVVRFGIPLVLGGAGYVTFISGAEDGPPKPSGAPQFKNVVYSDRLAGNLPTACVGLTKFSSPVPVVLGDYWSDEQCVAVGSQVLAKGQARVLDCIHVPVTQPILDSFSSHGHNNGEVSTCVSRAMGLLNAKRYEEACNALAHGPDGKPAWSYVKTGRRDAQGAWEYRFVQGLYNRRLKERSYCLKGVVELRARYDFATGTWKAEGQK